MNEFFEDNNHAGSKIRPVRCPYNKSHLIPNPNRVEQHVHKCRLAYQYEHNTSESHVELYCCKFSEYHKMPYPELSWHEERCFYKDSVTWNENFNVLNPRIEIKPKIPTKKEINDYKNSGIEDWNFEARIPRKTSEFDPAETIMLEGIEWEPTNVCKAELKAFRKLHSALCRERNEAARKFNEALGYKNSKY